jgi:hypothetical protein
MPVGDIRVSAILSRATAHVCAYGMAKVHTWVKLSMECPINSLCMTLGDFSMCYY